MNRRALVTWAVMVVAVLAAACGGDGPSSPSGSQAVVVKGVVMGSGGALGASANGPAVAAAAKQKVTVQVQGTTITAEVEANGTFELKGIPGGTFTLVFLVDGQKIGEVRVDAASGSEVKVVVEIRDSQLVVIEVKVEGGTSPTPGPSATPAACIINGGKLNEGIELEGDVTVARSVTDFSMKAAGATAPVDVNAANASYRCIGGAKTPTDAECRASLKAGAKVHVRGTLQSCTAAAALVKADEVKIQKD